MIGPLPSSASPSGSPSQDQRHSATAEHQQQKPIGDVATIEAVTQVGRISGCPRRRALHSIPMGAKSEAIPEGSLVWHALGLAGHVPKAIDAVQLKRILFGVAGSFKEESLPGKIEPRFATDHILGTPGIGPRIGLVPLEPVRFELPANPEGYDHSAKQQRKCREDVQCPSQDTVLTPTGMSCFQPPATVELTPPHHTSIFFPSPTLRWMLRAVGNAAERRAPGANVLRYYSKISKKQWRTHVQAE